MKISFDMSSIASPSASPSAAATSVRDLIVAHARQLLPSLPASVYEFVPFTLAGIMALLFTALLVLLVEDADDAIPNGSRQPTGGLSSASQKPSLRSSKRLVGLAEREKDAESGDDDWQASPWNPTTDMDASRRNVRQSQSWMAIQNEKIASSHGYRSTSKRLLATPPSSASPQSPAFAPPMLSMAKLIMHRHDQSSKRSRSSKTTSLPPSPPPAGATSFGSMQYTLKSATIRADKLALVSFPSAGPEDSPANQPSPPQRPSTDDTEKGTSSHRTSPSSNTRHARSRSLSISLPALNSLPALVPALQLLQSKPSQDRSVRRRPSSLLEEGGSLNESLPTHSRRSSSEHVPLISDDVEQHSLRNKERRSPEAIVELERGTTPR